MIPALNSCFSFFTTWGQNKTTCQYLTKRLHEILDTSSYFLNSEEMQVVKQAQEYLYTYCQQSGAPELRRYTLAALKSFYNVEKLFSEVDLENAVAESNKSLLEKWTKLGYSKEIFFSHPDFVKFIFDGHLHQSLKKFNHTVSLIEKVPHLLVNGELKDWYWIRQNIQVKKGVIVNKKSGDRYTYLQKGLTSWDPTQWTHSISIKKVPNPEREWQLQVVTSLAPPAQRGLIDATLHQGARHVHFRLINPLGEVFSYGLRRDEKDAPLIPKFLANARRAIVTPDMEEFLPRYFLETTLPINAEIAHDIEQHMRNAALEKLPFHYFGKNCTAMTCEILKKAGIELDARRHIVMVALTMLTSFRPLSWIREGIERLAEKISPFIPEIAKKVMRYVVHFIFMPVTVVVFSLLGAWKRGKDGTPPYYASLTDLFDPDKASVSLPSRVMNWQFSLGAKTALVQ